MSVILCFYLALMTLSQYALGRSFGRRILDISAHATLAEFDLELESKYGLHAIIGQNAAERSLQYFLMANATSGAAAGFSMASYSGGEVTGYTTLDEYKTLKEQIEAFAALRIASELCDELISQLIQTEEALAEAKPQDVKAELLEKYSEEMLEGAALAEEIRDAAPKLFEELRTALPQGESDEFSWPLPIRKNLTTLRAKENKLLSVLQKMKRSAQACEQAGKGETLKLSSAQLANLIANEAGNISLLDAVKGAKSGTDAANAGMDLLEEYVMPDLSGSVKARRISLTAIKRAVFGESSVLKTYAPDEEILDEKGTLYRNLPSRNIDYAQIGASMAELTIDLFSADSLAEFLKTGLLELAKETVFHAELCLYAEGMLRSLSDQMELRSEKARLNLCMAEKMPGQIKNETEYLIVGKNNEYKNVAGVHWRVLALRTVCNMCTLMSDEGKMAEIDALASATGGLIGTAVGEAVAKAFYLFCWSLLEAALDWNVLLDGGVVPLIKNSDQWKSSLSALEHPEESIHVGKGEGDKDGLDYNTYLRILLLMTPDELLLLRLKDLIYLDSGGKPLSDYVCGFSAKLCFEMAGFRFGAGGSYAY